MQPITTLPMPLPIEPPRPVHELPCSFCGNWQNFAEGSDTCEVCRLPLLIAACEVCDGEGQVYVIPDAMAYGYFTTQRPHWTECPECSGDGAFIVEDEDAVDYAVDVDHLIVIWRERSRRRVAQGMIGAGRRALAAARTWERVIAQAKAARREEAVA